MLRNDEMSDRELLLAIHKCAENGYVTSAEVAEELGLRVHSKSRATPAGVASSRLAYMANKGYLNRLDPKQFGHRKDERLWALTEFGIILMRGKISASLAKSISKASPGDRVMIMRELSHKAFVHGSMQEATAVRREWQHNFAQRH